LRTAADVTDDASHIKLFLSGDVMTGRGVDQILPHPSPPELHEPYVTSALDYVELAEEENGPVPAPVDHAYVWGDALEVLDRARPDVRIVNLETSVTTSEKPLPKGINYRMHPANVPVLLAAGIDCCTLANNHVLDWGEAGLVETLDTLAAAKIRTCGAGRDLQAAEAPAVLELGSGRRVLVFAFSTDDCGVPRSWAAGVGRAGVHRLPELTQSTIHTVARRVEAWKRPGDLAVASVHWGGNWGYDIRASNRVFAHHLIDHASIDVVHGHSSHHPKAIEIREGRPIFHGCGEMLNDYEGIRGHDEYRGELVLLYFPTFDAGRGALVRLEMVPFRIRRLRLEHASLDDRAWLRERLNRECQRFGHGIEERGGHLVLSW
jgi:poly-gamma-glutamate synthesis protein (capsule biosynthesis protein)